MLLQMLKLAQLIDFLNRYANLLLACLTAIYVWLTSQMLKSMRHESRRDIRIRHLQDIKSDVVEPILVWFDNRVLPMLCGQLSFVSSTFTKTLRPNTDFGEPQYDSVLELVRLAVEFPNVGHLFFHAEQTHFRLQLEAVDSFRSDLEELWEEYLQLAKQCDQELSKLSALPIRTGIDYPKEFVDNRSLIALSQRYLTAGEWPELRREKTGASDGLLLRAPAGSEVLALGARRSVEEWAAVSRQRIEKRWNISDLDSKTKKVLAKARAARESVSRITHTYDLHGDCEYVGGRPASPLITWWHRRLRRRLGLRE